MSDLPIAVQMWSVREPAEADLVGTFKQLAEMGFDGVELAGFYGLSAAELKKMLADFGLACAGSHAGYDTLLPESRQATIDYHLELGCERMIIPHMTHELRNSAASTLKTCQYLTQLAEALRPHGVHTGYHPHHDDMHMLDGGASAWELIADNTPDDFILQYDTGNGMHGGADPVEPIKRWPNRCVTLHLKEFVGKPGEEGLGLVSVGDGDIPWQDVFAAAESLGGTRWYIVEQDRHPDMSPLDAVKRGLENLRAMGK